MAKKVVASLQTGEGRNYTKCIKMTRSPKSGAYMFDEENKPFDFVGLISIPFLVSVLFSVFHIYIYTGSFGLWTGSLISLVGQMIVWMFVISVFYRPYFPKEKVVDLVKEFHGIVTDGIKKQFKRQRQLSES